MEVKSATRAVVWFVAPSLSATCKGKERPVCSTRQLWRGLSASLQTSKLDQFNQTRTASYHPGKLHQSRLERRILPSNTRHITCMVWQPL